MRAIIFDLDGTLFDDNQYIQAGFQRAATYLKLEYQIEALTDMIWEYAVNRHFDEVFQQVLDLHDLPAEEVDQLICEYHRNSAPLKPYADVNRLFEELDVKIPVGVVTGGKHGRQKLARLGLADRIDAIYVTPEEQETKYDEGPFIDILTDLDAAPERSIFVGDNPEMDFRWPNKLGMTTVWVRRWETLFTPPTTGELRPDYVLPTLDLLPQIARL